MLRLRSIVLALFVALTVPGLVARGFAQRKAEAVDGAAIYRVLDLQVAAWNRGDLEGYMAGYWKSEQLTFFSGGTVTLGWDATLARYRKRYQSAGEASMGKLDFSQLEVEPLSAQSAMVRGHWHLVMSDGKTPDGKQLGGLFTLILRRLPEGWRIVHDHTSSE